MKSAELLYGARYGRLAFDLFVLVGFAIAL
jgi:hypothetical protein